MKITVESIDDKYGFRPEMIEMLPELGAQGMTLAQMASHLCIPKRIFKSWITPGKACIPELALAFEEGQTHCQAGWERLATEASKGKVLNHSAGTFKLMVSSQFPEYRPAALEVGPEALESNDKVEIPEGVSATQMAQIYRDKMKQIKAGKS